MKRRLLTGWNFSRIMYVALGIAVIIESAARREWLGILLGSYFAAMGIFAFGCAAGNCFCNFCNTRLPNKKNEINEVNYSEVKQK